MIQSQKRERRDWTLLIFIIPLGILLILIVGQYAVRLVSFWSVNGDMNSNLEPDPNADKPFGLFEPILPQILIPMPWMESYLTPGADVYFPPFLTFSPTASPAPTEVTPTATEPAPTQVTPTETPSPTGTSDPGTASPTNTQGGEETEPPDDGGGSSTPPTQATTPATPPTGVVSTIDPSLTPAAPPTQLNVNATPDNLDDGNSDNIGHIADGTYIVISLSVTVSSTPDGNYDLVFYEWNNGGSVYLDLIIIGITNDGTGATYYEVFNWGDGNPDTNSNIGDVAVAAGGEYGDQDIPISDNNEVPVQPPEDQLYDPDHDPGNPPGIPETNGPLPQTGILIDVDTAPSDPPPDTYNFVVIISPPTLPGGDGGDAQVDAIQTVEVPTP